MSSEDAIGCGKTSDSSGPCVEAGLVVGDTTRRQAGVSILPYGVGCSRMRDARASTRRLSTIEVKRTFVESDNSDGRIARQCINRLWKNPSSVAKMESIAMERSGRSNDR
ncbi:unnamed protein product [Cyprideis torosa]|uniref:Uncharacterized protein n=1 Tax=Cyprideis torosa TaxID=163714 RepID=A0A7R8ZUP0_9CRUS|nr:unnamed protein product [Cyprideis torosa]CAG0900635.1 unnamed protein product [Cyprideis torosa]